MKRSYPLVVVLLIAGIVGACAPTGENEAIFIYGNLLVDKKTQCQAKPGGGANVVQRSLGTLDLLMAKRYLFFPIIANQLQPSAVATGVSTQELALEANNISVKGFWVSYAIEGLKGPYDAETEDAKTVLEQHWAPASGTVPANSLGPSLIELLPPPVIQALDKDKAFDDWGSAGIMTVTIVLEGMLGDGTLVHSTEYHFPLVICRGCLTQYEVPPDECWRENFEPTNYPCFPGQDDGYSCLTACYELDLAYNSDRAMLKKAMVVGYTDTLGGLDIEDLEPYLPEGFIPLSLLEQAEKDAAEAAAAAAAAEEEKEPEVP
jgi:hypothetical protein